LTPAWRRALCCFGGAGGTALERVVITTLLHFEAMAKEPKTLSDVVRAVGRVESAVGVLTEEVGGIKARLDGQSDLAAEVRRFADGQTALVNAVMRLVDIEGRLSRVEAKVFSAEH
jgi:hypothetical protein